jgi:Flp pilus assembly protein TadD
MSIKKISLAIALAAIFAVPFFPLVVANSYFFPFITGKAFVFRILVEVAFTAWVVLACVDQKYRPRLTPIFWAVTLFTFVALVADLIGVNTLRSLWSNFERMEGWITIVHLWGLFVVATSLFGPQATAAPAIKGKGKDVDKEIANPDHNIWWRRWILTSVAVAAVIALIALLQLDGVLEVHQSATRVDATLGNAAYMAVYMLLSAGMAAYLLVSEKITWTFRIKKDHIWTYWAAFLAALIVLAAFQSMSGGSASVGFFQGLHTFASGHVVWFLVALVVTAVSVLYPYYSLPLLFSFILFETQTRGTTLGLVGGVMLALLIYAIFARRSSMRSRQISGAVFCAIIILGAAFWLDRGVGFIQKNEVLSRLASISWNDTSSQARQYIWPMALDGALERPLLGWGQENFNYLFNAHYNPHMYGQEQWFDRAHNVFLDWLVASGLVGLLAYLSLYVFLLRGIWKSKLSMAEKGVLIGLVAGYAVHNLFVFDNLASYVMFFALLAFVNSFTTGEPVRWFGSKPVGADTAEYVIVPTAVVLLVAVLYFYNVRLIEANTRLISAMQSCQSPAPDSTTFERALNVGVYGANQEIREQLMQCTGNILAAQQIPDPTKQAYFTLTAGQIQDQIASTPKDARIYTLGGAFFNNAGQSAQGEALLATAHALSPAKQSIVFELATDYVNDGKTAEATAMLKTAYESAPEDTQARNAYVSALVLSGHEAEARALVKNDPAIFDTAQMAGVYINLKEYDKALAVYRDLVKANPNDTDSRVMVARIQFTMGAYGDAIATLRTLEKDHPEMKTQIETAIGQIQSAQQAAQNPGEGYKG